MGLVITFVRRNPGFHGRFLIFSHILLTFERDNTFPKNSLQNYNDVNLPID